MAVKITDVGPFKIRLIFSPQNLFSLSFIFLNSMFPNVVGFFSPKKSSTVWWINTI